MRIHKRHTLRPAYFLVFLGTMGCYRSLWLGAGESDEASGEWCTEADCLDSDGDDTGIGAPTDTGFETIETEQPTTDSSSDTTHIDSDTDFGTDSAEAACNNFDQCCESAVQDDVLVLRITPDGTPCDDRSVCTAQESCNAGRCEGGTLLTMAPELRSTAATALDGGPLGVGNDRFLFIRDDPRKLTLTRVNLNSFDILDNNREADTDIRWMYSIGDDLAAYSVNGGGGLLDLSEDTIKFRGKITTGSATIPHHFAITRDHLWACVSKDDTFGPNPTNTLLAFDVSDMDAPLKLDGEYALSDQCLALAPSADGQRVYVSVLSDTLVILPRAGEEPLQTSLGRPSHSVHVRHGYVTLANTQGVTVLRESDHEPVASLTAPVSIARYTTRGLEVSAYKPVPDGTDKTYAIYRLDEGALEPLTLLAEELLTHFDTTVEPSFSKWASADDALLDDPRAFRMNETPPYLTEIRDSKQPWPGWLRAEGTSIYLRDPSSAVHIDAVDPQHPVPTTVGTFEALPGLTLEVPAAGEVGLYGQAVTPIDPLPRRISTSAATSTTVHLRSFDAAQQPVEWAMHEFPAADGYLYTTYRTVYRLTFETQAGESVYRLQRFKAEWFREPVLPPPDIDLWIAPPKGEVLDKIAYAHDDTATAFATKPEGAGEGDPISNLYRIDLSAGGTVTGPLSLDVSVWDIAVHENRILVMGAEPVDAARVSLVFVAVEMKEGALAEVARTRWTTCTENRGFLVAGNGYSALHFDGRVGYLQLRNGTPDAPGPVVAGVLFDDLFAPPSVFPLDSPSPLWSFSASDTLGLVFSRPEILYIARPWCP